MEHVKSLIPTGGRMDQSEAPVVEALREYLEADVTSFVIPAHKQARDALQALLSRWEDLFDQAQA